MILFILGIKLCWFIKRGGRQTESLYHNRLVCLILHWKIKKVVSVLYIT